MKVSRSVLLASAALALSLVACSGDEGSARPVPIDSGAADVPTDGASKGEGGADRAAPDGGASDGSAHAG